MPKNNTNRQSTKKNKINNPSPDVSTELVEDKKELSESQKLSIAKNLRNSKLIAKRRVYHDNQIFQDANGHWKFALPGDRGLDRKRFYRYRYSKYFQQCLNSNKKNNKPLLHGQSYGPSRSEFSHKYDWQGHKYILTFLDIDVLPERYKSFKELNENLKYLQTYNMALVNKSVSNKLKIIFKFEKEVPNSDLVPDNILIENIRRVLKIHNMDHLMDSADLKHQSLNTCYLTSAMVRNFELNIDNLKIYKLKESSSAGALPWVPKKFLSNFYNKKQSFSFNLLNKSKNIISNEDIEYLLNNRISNDLPDIEMTDINNSIKYILDNNEDANDIRLALKSNNYSGSDIRNRKNICNTLCHRYSTYDSAIPRELLNALPELDLSYEKMIRIILASPSLCTIGFGLSVHKLARECDCHPQTVARRLDQLVKLDLLQITDDRWVYKRRCRIFKARTALLDTILETHPEYKAYREKPLVTSIEPGEWHSKIWEMSAVFGRKLDEFVKWALTLPGVKLENRWKHITTSVKSRARYLGIDESVYQTLKEYVIGATSVA